MVLTVVIVNFALGPEGASDWGLIVAGAFLVVAPLAVAFVAFQRQFVNNFVSTKAALKFWRDIALEHKAMPTGVTDSKADFTAFFAGKFSMIVLSTSALSFVRDNTEFDYEVAFIPQNVRNSVPIGGASLVSFKGTTPEQKTAAWDFTSHLSSKEVLGGWSRFTGCFSPRQTAHDLPEMIEFVKVKPDTLRAA